MKATTIQKPPDENVPAASARLASEAPEGAAPESGANRASRTPESSGPPALAPLELPPQPQAISSHHFLGRKAAKRTSPPTRKTPAKSSAFPLTPRAAPTGETVPGLRVS